MSSVTWDAEIAGVYDDAYAALFEPSVLGPMTGLLAELARGGPAVEFAAPGGWPSRSVRGESRCTVSNCPGPWRSGCSPSPAPARSR